MRWEKKLIRDKFCLKELPLENNEIFSQGVFGAHGMIKNLSHNKVSAVNDWC